MIRDVIESLANREREVRDRKGHTYSLRVRPYRTTDNKIDGAVVTLMDIDELKRQFGLDVPPREPRAGSSSGDAPPAGRREKPDPS
jgi:two-component system CheB/CheR fusion protein